VQREQERHLVLPQRLVAHVRRGLGAREPAALKCFCTGISETVPRLFATGSSSASTWKLSHHLPPYH
jgi:hypothetical protein